MRQLWTHLSSTVSLRVGDLSRGGCVQPRSHHAGSENPRRHRRIQSLGLYRQSSGLASTSSLWKTPPVDSISALFRLCFAFLFRATFARQREPKMSGATAALPHGTPERWQADCDCSECNSAMWTMVSESRIDGPSAWTLADMLRFRVRGCELYVVPAMVSEQRGGCVATIRRRIDRLVEFGALSKIADIEGPLRSFGNLRFARREIEDAGLHSNGTERFCD